MSDFTLVHVGCAPRSTRVREGLREPDCPMPVGCLYVAAALQGGGYSVDFRDYQFCAGSEDPRDPDTLTRFCEGAADVLGVSCLVDFLPITVLALERFKRLRPEATLVLGGPGPSAGAEALLRAFPWIDVIVVGEGEVTMLELMKQLESGDRRGLASVAGIAYREGDQVRSNPPRARIRSLDELPFPHPAGVDLTRYRLANVISSRGCPYQCAFCDVAQLWGRQTTCRSVDNVIEEMRALFRLGFRHVSIQDDNFTVKRKRVGEFCAKTAGRADLPAWACLGRVDLVDSELLCQMKEGGCEGIFYGIESGSDRILADIMKNITVQVACRAVEATLDQFRGVEAYFIWGFPSETTADLMQTMLLMAYFQSLGALTPLSLLSPLPHSTLYLRGQHELSLDPRLSPFNAISGGPLARHHGRVLDLVRTRPDLFPSFYTYPTPNLEAKLTLMRRFKPINDLELLRSMAC